MDSDRQKVAPEVVDSGEPLPSPDAQRRASGEGNGSPAPPPGGGAEGGRQAPAPADVEAQGAQTPVESEFEALSAKAAKADEYLALAQRTKADFENYRKRAVREAAAAQERGAVKLAMALLPAIDNLERALAHAGTEAGDGVEPAPESMTGDGDDSFLEGIRHVHADVIAALGRAGIERYSPEGERFDPLYHEAVAQQPVQGAEPGGIVEVFQPGYRVGETVVRPARVMVAG